MADTTDPRRPETMPPNLAISIAAEHVRSGVPEIELEWWSDIEGDERRFTVSVRRTDRNASLRYSASRAILAQDGDMRSQVRDAAGHPIRTYEVPDTPEGLEDPP